jgi:ribonuclease T2
MTASNYFRTIANYAARLRVPPEFNAAGEVPVQRANLIHQLQSLNPGLPAEGIQLRCVSNYRFNAPVLTEMRVCYSADGHYTACPAVVRSSCPSSFVVQGAP